jgi:hypothetical protein
MRLAAAWMLVIGCTDGSSEPGELRSFANDGSGLQICDATAPWCAYDGVIEGNHIELSSRTTDLTVGGTLSLFGLEQLELAVDTVPASTPAESFTCEDVPRLELVIEYASSGLRTFRYDCEPGVLAPVHDLVATLRSSLIDCTTTTLVSCSAN